MTIPVITPGEEGITLLLVGKKEATIQGIQSTGNAQDHIQEIPEQKSTIKIILINPSTAFVCCPLEFVRSGNP